MQRRENQAEAWMLEDGLDESIGIGSRFVYSEFRAGAGKQIDQSVLSQLVMQLARRQFGINSASAKLAPVAPECCFKPVAPSLARWCLFGGRFLKLGRYCCCRPAESLSFDSSILSRASASCLSAFPKFTDFVGKPSLRDLKVYRSRDRPCRKIPAN
ncbi:hypothetical protein [Microcoleus sp. AR_TQ3_B6]|uniref:hypothetical protein n=1 Tax=Microcoleus sp. AR_TQ3_B6 TaxID=3055284 RepID=UPI00403F62AA